MITITTDSNTRTGYRAVQVYGHGFKWRLDAVRFRTLTGRDTTSIFSEIVGKSKSGVINSRLFSSKEECAQDLCRFLEQMTGDVFGF